MTTKTLTWLHLSDLHAGMGTQTWLWPNLKEQFFEDLRRIHQSTGGWDLVIFSGDLTQNGTCEDYGTLNIALREIWEKFNQLGCNPQLFVVPGNHDLTRVDEADPTAIALQNWWSNNIIKENFWKSDTSAYRVFIKKAFENFEEWQSNLHLIGINLARLEKGVLPGDSSAVISINDIKLGLIGLNTTFLQVSGDKTFGKLDLDNRQLLSVTDAAPDEWCRKNDVNFLVTHHPTSWLEERAQRQFREEIYKPSRFAAHFFGHMHKPEVSSISAGGSSDRRLVQGASLYGLRKVGTGELDRIHGYSAGKLEINGEGGIISFWPRISTVVGSGTRRFVADMSFDLTESNFFTVNLKINNDRFLGSNLVVAPTTELFRPPFSEIKKEIVLPGKTRTRHILPASPHHQYVRRVEQDKLSNALSTKQQTWLVTDWGYGTDEFLWTVLEYNSTSIPKTFKLNLEEYAGKDDFLERIVDQTGCSFQEFCKALAAEEKVYLILENSPVGRESIPNSSLWETEVLEIANAIHEYCSNVSVLPISRLQPASTQVVTVNLLPLDEPDVRAYLLNHSSGGSEFVEENAVLEIYRLSGGLPIQIDNTLNQLRLMTLSELIESRIADNGEQSRALQVSNRVTQVVDELALSNDPDTKRAYALLTALTCFPYGETLIRIRRFFQDTPFYPSDIQLLLDRGLVEIQIISIKLPQSASSLEQPRKILSKKAVRDYILSLMSENDQYKLYSLAAAIYFGDQWAQGKPKTIKTADLVTSLGGEGGLCNPEAIINFLLSNSIQINDETRLGLAISLARLFASNLENNDYFRSCANACRGFLSTLHDAPEKYGADKNILKFYLAKSLRMLGLDNDSKNIFLELEKVGLSRLMQQRVLLNLALTIKGDVERQIELANKTISMGKGTASALHANALLLQLNTSDPDQMKKLSALEEIARRKKAVTIANNIAVFRARNSNGTAETKSNQLQKIALNARANGDPYSAALISLSAAQLVSKSPTGVPDSDIDGLVRAYHYLYSERIGPLFNRCHELLWNYFETKGSITNLLRMFRHSSFIWRICGEDTLEQSYLKKLLFICKEDGSSDLLTADQETAYFICRARRLAAFER